MSLEKIVNAVTGLLEKARTPIVPIPAIILACSLFKRPGASAMATAANIIKRQSEFGAPTGVMPDGSPNMINSLIYLIVSEVYRELAENGVVEVAIPANISTLKEEPLSFTLKNESNRSLNDFFSFISFSFLIFELRHYYTPFNHVLQDIIKKS